jgi:hypothetical protein
MMNRFALDNIVPIQTKGRKAKVHISRHCSTIEAASKLYEFLKISLADVNNWGEFRPGISFYTKLVNKNGQILRRIARSDDLIKILLPRWQTVGRLYDWRKITRMEERMNGDMEIFFITIAPAMSPELEMPEASHFLRPESTVTFFVIRDVNKLQLEVHTRNEGLNFQWSGFKAKLQSVMMGVFIAGGFYEIQWTRLMKSVLRYGMKQMKISG